MYLTYVPGDLCIELKSLKLYLWSFRNDGIFYERAVNRILDDLVAVAQPRWFEVKGDFAVRGGIKSIITAAHGTRPAIG
jgi:7-cyano-7-deazaguanine reductase